MPRSKKKKTLPTRRSARKNPPEPIPEEEEESSQPEDTDDELPLRIILPPVRPTNPEPEQEEDTSESENELGPARDGESLEDDSSEKAGTEMEEETTPVIPAKRKNASKAGKQRNQKKKLQKDDNRSERAVSDEPAVIPLIGYTVTTISAEEMKKPATRRKVKATLIELSSQLEWVDFKGRLKIAICDKLFPGVAVVDDDCFEMTWSIPRVVPNPLSLSTAVDYEILIKKALKAAEPAVKISVEEIEKVVMAQPDDQENIPPPLPGGAGPPAQLNQPNDAQTKKKEKTKSRKEADILPGNIAINEKIKEIRAEWECSSSRCISDMCFVPAEGDHLPLSMEHIEKWAAAILAGTATLQTPPNHRLFDAVSKNRIISKSPLLQARLNARNNTQGPAPAATPAPAPVFNVVLPNNFGAPFPNFPGGNAMPPATNTSHEKSLIPNGYMNGPHMEIADFCAVYNIPDRIKARLQENEITGTHAFGHISESDLRDMDFKLGQIIDFKEAIKRWAQPTSTTEY